MRLRVRLLAGAAAVAIELGLPINGTALALRSEAFKSAGRRLFERTGVLAPLGREDVRTVDDGVEVRDPSSGPSPSHAVRAAVAALPAWYRDDLAAGGGVVDGLVVGDDLRSPSAQIDLLPGGWEWVADADGVPGRTARRTTWSTRPGPDDAMQGRRTRHAGLCRRGCCHRDRFTQSR